MTDNNNNDQDSEEENSSIITRQKLVPLDKRPVNGGTKEEFTEYALDLVEVVLFGDFFTPEGLPLSADDRVNGLLVVVEELLDLSTVLVNQDLDDHVVTLAALIYQFRDAFERNEFELFYEQFPPDLDLSNGVNGSDLLDYLAQFPPEIQKHELDKMLKTLQEENGACFLAGTPVSMPDGSTKPIEEIVSGDLVLSYDKDGELVPGRVTRTFQNRSKHILDLFGLMTTPGHVTYCADGKYAGRHVPVIDILRSDGALMREDGTKVRAATGCELETDGDDLIWAIAGDKNADGTVNAKERGLIRAGTRFILENGKDFSVLELIEAAGGMITEDGFIQTSEEGEKMPFHWRFTESLPKPEDYVLQRSQVSLAEIFGADEWEAVAPQMARPASPSRPTVIAPNIPLSMVGAEDQPAMTAAEREVFEERQAQKAHRASLQ